jgi:ABC-type branched-subunit amino acid transport system substrate-binding protein
MGASGPMGMDSNGDRASQDYAVWTVVMSQGTYAFKNIGGWAASTSSVTYSS